MAFIAFMSSLGKVTGNLIPFVFDSPFGRESEDPIEKIGKENVQVEVSNAKEPSRKEMFDCMKAIQESWAAAMIGNMLPLNTAFDKMEELLKRIENE